MPLAGWLYGVGEAGPARRLPALTIWLVLVVTPALLVAHYANPAEPTAAPVGLGADLGAGNQVLRLPAGTHIPLRIDMDSPILAISPNAGLDMTLTQPVEVALSKGSPDGRYRIGEGNWHSIHDGVLRLRIDRIKPQLGDNLPEVRLHSSFAGPGFKGTRP